MTDPNDDAWNVDWDALRRRKFTIGLAATSAQRLDWLEEMIEVARYGRVAATSSWCKVVGTF